MADTDAMQVSERDSVMLSDPNRYPTQTVGGMSTLLAARKTSTHRAQTPSAAVNGGAA